MQKNIIISFLFQNRNSGISVWRGTGTVNVHDETGIRIGVGTGTKRIRTEGLKEKKTRKNCK